MSRRLRIYYYAVFGALGGLIGWQVSNMIGLGLTSNLFLSDAITGGLLGLALGLALGAAEGAVALSPMRAAKMGALNGLVGMLGGAIGLPVGEWLFQALGGEVVGRALGWAVLGGLIGTAEGVIGGTRTWKGALGGALGGLVGGAALELLRPLTGSLLAGKGLGLVLLGASIGAFMALVVVLLSRAWFEVISGKLKGTEFILDKFLHEGSKAAAIGSSPLKADIVLPDPDIAPQHALLQGAGTHFNLQDISLSGTFLNGRKIEKASLRDGQNLRLGNTTMVYHERR
jgi:hypothetical protein